MKAFAPVRPEPARRPVQRSSVASALDDSPRMIAQREQLGGMFGTAAQLAAPKEEEVLQNKTGLPDQLKAGVESLSGMDISDVRVHQNSALPAQLNALAYAQGNDIHVAPGQAKHLPHEAWHVVQQREGRVKPTMQMQGVAINDDKSLEEEADAMGAKALSGPLQRRAVVAQRVTVTTENYETLTTGTGNYAVGTATKTQANKIGALWVGKALGGNITVSDDLLRQYRKPALKKRSGVTNANLEARTATSGPWTSNGHISIVAAEE